MKTVRFILVIIFLISVGRNTTAEESNFEIYLMNADGTHQERLTNSSGADLNPSFSPDGRKVVFESDRDGDKEIYVIDILNKKTIKLTDNSIDDFDPAWSPDGENIVFVSNRDGNNEIYIMNKNGGLQQRLTNNKIEGTSPSWSPDGKRITYVHKNEIYLMKIKTKFKEKLTQGEKPLFSPDGGKIVFSQRGDIYFINVKSRNIERLTTTLAIEKEPVWAPNGRIIAFTSYFKDTSQEIKTINIETNQINPLTENYSSSCNPAYSPNGIRIAFSKDILSKGLSEEDEDIRLLKQASIKISLFYFDHNKANLEKLLYEAIKGMVKEVKDESLKLVGSPAEISLLKDGKKIEIQTGTNTINIDCVKQVFNFIKTNYKDISSRKLVYAAINQMVESLEDPFSKFTDQDSLFDPTIFMGMTGLNIEQDKEGNIFVLTVVEDSPGYKIGIKPGDEIIEINGESLIGKSKEEVSAKLRGPLEKYTSITIERNGKRHIFTFPFGLFKEEYFKSQIIENKIGYVHITQFYSDVKEKWDKAFKEFRKAQVIGLILDLRNSSGGGYLEDMVAIANRFLSPGSIIGATEGGIFKWHTTYKADLKENNFYLPLAIIVDHSTLGGGEIVASAIKENKRGVVIGTNTYGRTSLQNDFLLLDGSRLFLTTSKWYTPIGNSIEGVGLRPDIPIEEECSPLQEAIKLITKKYQERIATYTISHIYTTTEGLPGNQINCLAIQKNLLWIGTDKGLCRYNKTSGTWTTYTTKDGLSGDFITCIAIKDDEIWIGTREGVSRLDKNLGWVVFVEGVRANMGAINDIAIEDKNKGLEGDNIWVGSVGGLWKFDRQNLVSIPKFQPVTQLNSIPYRGSDGKTYYITTTTTEYHSIKKIEIFDNYLCVLSVKPGLAYSIGEKEWEYCYTYPTSTSSSLFSILFSPIDILCSGMGIKTPFPAHQMSLDTYKNMWINSLNTLYYFHPDSIKFTYQIKINNNIFDNLTSFFVDEHNYVWCAFEKMSFMSNNTLKKLIQFDGDYRRILHEYTIKDGLPNVPIISIASDGDKIWLGTKGGGLILMERNKNGINGN